MPPPQVSRLFSHLVSEHRKGPTCVPGTTRVWGAQENKTSAPPSEGSAWADDSHTEHNHCPFWKHRLHASLCRGSQRALLLARYPIGWELCLSLHMRNPRSREAAGEAGSISQLVALGWSFRRSLWSLTVRLPVDAVDWCLGAPCHCWSRLLPALCWAPASSTVLSLYSQRTHGVARTAFRTPASQ